MIQAYVFLGSAGSGRREVIADLLDAALEGSVVLLPQGEAARAADASIEKNAAVLRWENRADDILLPELPENADTVLIVLDGTADPVDQLEKLVLWFKEHEDVELARIITVLNSRLLYENPQLKLWFDACIRFSDVVLFNMRADVPNKWFSDFQQRFVKDCYPCMFEFVKNGRVRNPAEILCTETRRMSLAFDFEEDQTEPDSADLLAEDFELDIEIEDDDVDDGVEDTHEEEVAPEPYFELDFSGRRKIRLPDIRDSL